MRTSRENRSWWWRLLRSRLMLAIGLLLIGFVGWSLVNEINRGDKTASDLAKLQSQIVSLEKQNADHANLISRLGTLSFIEREARTKLGYQKQGEQVLVLRDPAALSDKPTIVSFRDETLTNPQRWWQYFFASKQSSFQK